MTLTVDLQNLIRSSLRPDICAKFGKEIPQSVVEMFPSQVRPRRPEPPGDISPLRLARAVAHPHQGPTAPVGKPAHFNSALQISVC